MFTYSKGYYKLRALEIGSFSQIPDRFAAFAGSYSLVQNEEQFYYLKMKYIGWGKFNLSQVTSLSSPKSIALTTRPRLTYKNDVEEKMPCFRFHSFGFKEDGSNANI